MRYVKQNRNLPRIASKSAVVTVLYSPSDTRSRKKMTLLELEGTQPQRTYLTQRLSCENLQQRNDQQPECSEMVVLLIHELFQTDKLFFLRYMGSLSAEHQKLIIAMEILTCLVSLAICFCHPKTYSITNIFWSVWPSTSTRWWWYNTRPGTYSTSDW